MHLLVGMVFFSVWQKEGDDAGIFVRAARVLEVDLKSRGCRRVDDAYR